MKLVAKPLSQAAFAAFGDVIETAASAPMNAGCFARSVAQTVIDIELPGQARIDVVSCTQTTTLPHQFDLLERHPLGSQAFVPLSGFIFVVVVAIGDERPGDLHAFVSNGRQGINYRRGTWHLPMMATEGQQFLLIERDGEEANCEEYRLPEAVTLVLPE